jgi:hypothetical protein
VPFWVVAVVLVSMALGLFAGWIFGPVSDELRAFRARGCYFGNQTQWTWAKRWVAFWYGRNKA